MALAAAACAEAAAALGVLYLGSAAPAVHTFASRFAGLDVTAMVCLDSAVVTAALGAALSAAGEAVA